MLGNYRIAAGKGNYRIAERKVKLPGKMAMIEAERWLQQKYERDCIAAAEGCMDMSSVQL